MNRPEIVDELAAKFGHLTRNDTELAVNLIFEALSSALVTGRRMQIRGFGSFSMKQRQARIRRDPRNGDRVAVPARRVVHFKPGKSLHESVDRQDQPA
jgi:integration host factor subunit beta